MQITTDKGYTCEIQIEALNDYELLEDLIDVEDGQPALVVKVARKLLSKDDYAALKELCRAEDGRVSMVEMFGQISEIIRKLQEGSTQAKK